MTRSLVEDVWPLSPLQEGLLFHAAYDDEGPDVYQGQRTLELTGPLDADRLRRSWEALLTRHGALRAGFRGRKSGETVQVIAREAALPWRAEDLSRLAEADALSEAGRLAEDERSRRFDPAVAPLLRLLLIRLGDERHRLVLTSHHVVMDGWSMAVLFNELPAVYAADGTTHGLPRTTSYRDYLVWLGRQDKEAARAAWREELAGADEPTLVAPVDPARTPVAPESLITRLSGELTHGMSQLARSLGVTVNTVVQGAWALLLARLAGRTDVVFGATVAGRPAELPGVESMVGLFINTLPVRVPLDGAQTVARMLAALQDRQAALMAHQHLGLSEVQKLAGSGAVFDTIVVYENYPRPRGRSRPRTPSPCAPSARRRPPTTPSRWSLLPRATAWPSNSTTGRTCSTTPSPGRSSSNWPGSLSRWWPIRRCRWAGWTWRVLRCGSGWWWPGTRRRSRCRVLPCRGCLRGRWSGRRTWWLSRVVKCVCRMRSWVSVRGVWRRIWWVVVWVVVIVSRW
ncbi:condensation domain-containing protein [Streptomyces alfalfae]|uniref:Condensation domain-containing protein n=1 Tax=Streptomyces alfalfae TaxID=1642299 RepID=A0A7T4PQ33_9ACTN|nr:condensation domain-containing protein [Streptomyces alfalfae]QQC94269.1 hypothetical protein I8755_34220 [Streptomyces alfalfae]